SKDHEAAHARNRAGRRVAAPWLRDVLRSGVRHDDSERRVPVARSYCFYLRYDPRFEHVPELAVQDGATGEGHHERCILGRHRLGADDRVPAVAAGAVRTAAAGT